MIDEVIRYFREKDRFIEFQNMNFNSLNVVFGSPQQIFGIAAFENENILQRDWKKVSEEFAVKVQSQLTGSLYNLKWDMYLVLVLQSNIENLELCKDIENDRSYFKKIVIAKNLREFYLKLPIELELENSDHLELFSDKQFLTELKKIVSTDVANRLDISVYENKSIEKANDMVFLDPYRSRGINE